MRVVLSQIESEGDGATQSSVDQEGEGSASNSTPLLKKVKYIHFVKDNEFEEIEEFRTNIEQMYDIKVQLYSKDFKREVQRVIDEDGIKAIIMGNRRTDPWS